MALGRIASHFERDYRRQIGKTPEQEREEATDRRHTERLTADDKHHTKTITVQWATVFVSAVLSIFLTIIFNVFFQDMIK